MLLWNVLLLLLMSHTNMEFARKQKSVLVQNSRIAVITYDMKRGDSNSCVSTVMDIKKHG